VNESKRGKSLCWRPGVRDLEANAQERRYRRYIHSRLYGDADPDNAPTFTVLP
jgi:hypothetical protein